MIKLNLHLICRATLAVGCLVCFTATCAAEAFSAAVPDSVGSSVTALAVAAKGGAERPDSVAAPLELGIVLPGDEAFQEGDDALPVDAPELVLAAPEAEEERRLAMEEAEPKRVFNPDPTRAVWMSALFPGLGQLYNRRYWKLPIIVGGFMGLGYGTSWNNTMLRDYTRAYADLLDNDPSTKSYMDFFPPNVTESQLDKEWLTNLMRSRRNFYRRNRDLCIIAMVGVYLLAVVDAYVDASLSHFDITPDLSMDLAPTLIPDGRTPRPGLGLLWAVNF